MKPTIYCKTNIDTYENVPVEKFIFRPSAYGIIINDHKIITLKNKSNHKFWFPGGGVNIDERLEDALRREIKEETGLDNIEIKKMLLFKENYFYYKPLDEAYHAFLFFYLCTTSNIELIKKADDLESKHPQWTDIDSIKAEDISDLKEDLFQLIQNLNKEPKL